MVENLGAFKSSEVFDHSKTPKYRTSLIISLERSGISRMIHMIWGRGFGRKLDGGRVWDALEKG